MSPKHNEKTDKKIKFIPTAVGSLPYKTNREALGLVFQCFPDAPVIPQLANISQNEDMLFQFNENIPGVIFDKDDNRWYMEQESEGFFEQLEEFFLDYECIVNEKQFELLDKYGISEKNCSSMSLFLEKISQTSPPFIKGQIIGAFTFGTSLVDREKKCVFYDETLREIYIKGLTLKALWLVKQYQKACPSATPIIFMDEPTISQWGTSAFITVKKEDVISSISEIASVLQKNGALVGVHCCGKSDWSLITESGVDILNFDAFYFSESLVLFSTEIGNFLKKGGKIAWGLIPTMDTDALEAAKPEYLIDKFEKAKTLLVNKGIDEELIINNSLVTPSCGAGILTVEQAQKAMELTSLVAKSLQEKYG